MIQIKIISAECKKCRELENLVNVIIRKNNFDAAVIKITDIHEMVNYGYYLMPALIINEKLKSSGYLPKENKITQWIKEILYETDKFKS